MLATLYTSYHIPKMYRLWDSGQPNKLLPVKTVDRHGFHNGAIAYMLQFRNCYPQSFYSMGSICESNISMLKS